VAQYGIPPSTFVIKGLVLSEKNDKPIKDIKVDFIHKKHVTHDFVTNSKGEFFFYIDEKNMEDTLFISVIDVDGNENGSFQQKDTLFKGNYKELKRIKNSNIDGNGEIPFNIYLKPEGIKPKEEKEIDNK